MISHPSHAGLLHVVAARLERDGFNSTQAQAEAQEVCGAIWKLSKFVRRSDIPATVAFLREPRGVTQRLLRLADEQDDVAS